MATPEAKLKPLGASFCFTRTLVQVDSVAMLSTAQQLPFKLPKLLEPADIAHDTTLCLAAYA